jgi:hypothetical protein
MIAMEGGNAIELSGTILAQLNQLLTGYRITAMRYRLVGRHKLRGDDENVFSRKHVLLNKKTN